MQTSGLQWPSIDANVMQCSCRKHVQTNCTWACTGRSSRAEIWNIRMTFTIQSNSDIIQASSRSDWGSARSSSTQLYFCRLLYQWGWGWLEPLQCSCPACPNHCCQSLGWQHVSLALGPGPLPLGQRALVCWSPAGGATAPAQCLQSRQGGGMTPAGRLW